METWCAGCWASEAPRRCTAWPGSAKVRSLHLYLHLAQHPYLRPAHKETRDPPEMSLEAASMSPTSKAWAAMAREASVWPTISLFSTASPGCLQIFWRWLAGPRASTSLAPAQAVPSSAPAPSACTPCRTLTQHRRTIPRLVVFERTLWVFQPDVTFEIYFLFRITKEKKKTNKKKSF